MVLLIYKYIGGYTWSKMLNWDLTSKICSVYQFSSTCGSNPNILYEYMPKATSGQDQVHLSCTVRYIWDVHKIKNHMVSAQPVPLQMWKQIINNLHCEHREARNIAATHHSQQLTRIHTSLSMAIVWGLVDKVESTKNWLFFGKCKGTVPPCFVIDEMLGGFRMFWGWIAGTWARLSLALISHSIPTHIPQIFLKYPNKYPIWNPGF
jgi:hypothetical protein